MLNSTNPKIHFLAGTLGRGGAERQLVYMLRALKVAGVALRVLCLTKGEAYEDEIRDLGIDVEWVGSSQNRQLRLLNIVRALRRNRPDIIQSVHFYTNMYAAAAARAVRIKDIGAIRCDVATELRDNGRAGRWGLRLPGDLIANTKLACERAVAEGVKADRVHFVQNVVDTEYGPSLRTKGNDEAIRILFAGRMIEQKRPDRFLRVFSEVARKSPPGSVKAIVAGDGPLTLGLPKLVYSLGLRSGQVEILGERTDLRSVYRHADIFMLTSDYEGTPNVVLEAMAAGLAVVATRVGGVPELIANDRGFVVEPEDEDKLAASTLQLVGDGDLRKRFGFRGFEYAKSFHSLNALQTRLLEIYRTVLSR